MSKLEERFTAFSAKLSSALQKKPQAPTVVEEKAPDLSDFSSLPSLSDAEVAERVADGRVNGNPDLKTKTIPQILWTNFFTFFNILFIALAILLAFFVEKSWEGFANFGFMGVVTLNFLFGVFQEIKAKRTIDKLSLLSAPKVSAVRNGQEVVLQIKDIVLDDILLLRTGNQVCSDSVVTQGTVEVNESMLTGESDPVVKNVGDEILSGSFVVSGTAITTVVRVGKDNYAAKISNGAKYIKPTNSVILRSVMRFIKMMAIVILPLGIGLFCVKYFVHGGELYPTILTVIGTIIGMIPSGLMLLTTGVFCVSVIRLASHKALAQDLYCTESLARVDVLCLDKTGTITEGKMEVVNLVPNDAINDEIQYILKNMMHAIGDQNPTADAITAFTKDTVVTEEASSVIAFSSARKWSAATFPSGTYVLGAAEFIFPKRTQKMQRILDYHADNGNRVLVLASCQNIKDNRLPVKMQLLGYVVLSDIIRLEAPKTLAYFDEQGVQIKIISGDNPITVKSVAKRAGVKNYDKYIDASTLKTEEDIAAALREYTVFGRVSPDQKLSIVKALKNDGHTVAMTGDGVNDVLALKEADCSIAMAAGSDAAKNVSNLVLLDSNFASMPRIVAEGRRSINNLERSSSLFLMKTGYAFLLSIIFMILQADLPFQPKHLTLLGALTIGIPSYILALQPNKERIKGRFFAKVLTNALPGSFTIAIAILAVVLSSRLITVDEVQISTMCLLVTAFIGFVYLAKISFPFNALRVTLLVCMIAMFVTTFLGAYLPIDLTSIFGLTTNFTPDMVKIVVPVALLSVPVYVGIAFLFHKLGKLKILDRALDKLKL